MKKSVAEVTKAAAGAAPPAPPPPPSLINKCHPPTHESPLVQRHPGRALRAAPPPGTKDRRARHLQQDPPGISSPEKRRNAFCCW
ncbi:hypothetical protein E2C01_097478 [Portunus trituberculatus]|uniref:Uncharacterized protein n=1 Tax=Portunus trituberculatus TaxID=210409 RepID=A0A5B7KA14_PORTR|nr:hypothetical protein [Portunus trituberculatus]